MQLFANRKIRVITIQKNVFMITILLKTLSDTFSEKIFFESRLPTLVGVDLGRPPRNLTNPSFEKFQI